MPACDRPDCGRASNWSSIMTAITCRPATAGFTGSPVSGSATRTGVGDGVGVGAGVAVGTAVGDASGGVGVGELEGGGAGGADGRAGGAEGAPVARGVADPPAATGPGLTV